MFEDILGQEKPSIKEDDGVKVTCHVCSKEHDITSPNVRSLGISISDKAYIEYSVWVCFPDCLRTYLCKLIKESK